VTERQLPEATPFESATTTEPIRTMIAPLVGSTAVVVGISILYIICRVMCVRHRAEMARNSGNDDFEETCSYRRGFQIRGELRV
jgi:hypothetical protein